MSRFKSNHCIEWLTLEKGMQMFVQTFKINMHWLGLMFGGSIDYKGKA